MIDAIILLLCFAAGYGLLCLIGLTWYWFFGVRPPAPKQKGY